MYNCASEFWTLAGADDGLGAHRVCVTDWTSVGSSPIAWILIASCVSITAGWERLEWTPFSPELDGTQRQGWTGRIGQQRFYT